MASSCSSPVGCLSWDSSRFSCFLRPKMSRLKKWQIKFGGSIGIGRDFLIDKLEQRWKRQNKPFFFSFSFLCIDSWEWDLNYKCFGFPRSANWITWLLVRKITLLKVIILLNSNFLIRAFITNDPWVGWHLLGLPDRKVQYMILSPILMQGKRKKMKKKKTTFT